MTKKDRDRDDPIVQINGQPAEDIVPGATLGRMIAFADQCDLIGRVLRDSGGGIHVQMYEPPTDAVLEAFELVIKVTRLQQRQQQDR